MTFEEAKAHYPHRFTMEHVPDWAKRPLGRNRFYAPQYRTDLEWFQNTIFPPENPLPRRDCWSRNQTWPLGKWLGKPYVKGMQ